MAKERKKKHKAGDRLGPNKILLKQRTKRVGQKYFGIFECPYCGEDFECGLNEIVRGRYKSCGCHQYKDRKGKRKYKEGDIVGPYNTKIIAYDKPPFGEFLCSFCGQVFRTNIQSVARGDTRSCGCQAGKTYRENGRARMTNLTGRRFSKLTVIGESPFRNGGNRILWECQCDCGKISYVRTSDLLKGEVISCGCSKISRGEFKIINALKDLGITFEREKVFDDCINPETNVKLRFDFYLPDYNCCIEYDGEQHFKSGTGKYNWNTSEHLRRNQQRDKVKNIYCKEHKIPLIRIPYTDFKKMDKEYLKNKISEIFA